MTASAADLRAGFGEFGGRIWLNCAHQGPLPLAAAEEAREAVAWKLAPHELTAARFGDVPRRLKRALARLIGAPPEEIVLTNGASYGVHLLANGLPLEPGDAVLLMEGDFPSNLLPWLALADRGVAVRRLAPRRFVLSADEVAAGMAGDVRVLCMSWVHSFSGRVADLGAIGELCRERGVLFVVNTTQGLGAKGLAVGELPVDALVNAGWKWLCGPYATGFCWMRPEVERTLRHNQAYWLSIQTAEDLESEGGGLRLPSAIGARRWDVFGTANFFNFKPWAAAVEHLLALGLDRIARHDERLVRRLRAGIDGDRYELLEPGGEWSPLVFVSARDRGRNPGIHRRLADEGIDCALRRGRLRFSPHLYNTEAEIDRVLTVLDRA